MSGVEVTAYPDGTTAPEGHINPGGLGPFAVVDLFGPAGGARVLFLSSTAPADQARYLRALAEVATRLADELDAEGAA